MRGPIDSLHYLYGLELMKTNIFHLYFLENCLEKISVKRSFRKFVKQIGPDIQK